MDVLAILATLSNSAVNQQQSHEVLPYVVVLQCLSGVKKITGARDVVDVTDFVGKIDIQLLMANIKTSVDDVNVEVKNAILYEIFTYVAHFYYNICSTPLLVLIESKFAFNDYAMIQTEGRYEV